MTFEEWWKKYKRNICPFDRHYEICKDAWDARQAEIDELKREILRLREKLKKEIENFPGDHL